MNLFDCQSILCNTDSLDWVSVILGISSIIFAIAGIILSVMLLLLGRQIRQAVTKEEEQLNKRIDEKVKKHIEEIQKVGQKQLDGIINEHWKKKGGKDGKQ